MQEACEVSDVQINALHPKPRSLFSSLPCSCLDFPSFDLVYLTNPLRYGLRKPSFVKKPLQTTCPLAHVTNLSFVLTVLFKNIVYCVVWHTCVPSCRT